MKLQLCKPHRKGKCRFANIKQLRTNQTNHQSNQFQRRPRREGDRDQVGDLEEEGTPEETGSVHGRRRQGGCGHSSQPRSLAILHRYESRAQVHPGLEHDLGARGVCVHH